MHAQAYEFVKGVLRAELAVLANAERLDRYGVLEMGSRDVNGSVRDLFPRGVAYVGVDREPGPGVDLVMDAAAVVGMTPAIVVCCETLEHEETPERLIRHAARILVPGGLLIVTCAGPGRKPHSGIDGGRLRAGEHYRNIPPAELSMLLSRYFPRTEVTFVPFYCDTRGTARNGGPL